MKLFIASDLLAGGVPVQLVTFYIVARYIDCAPLRLASTLVSAPRALGRLMKPSFSLLQNTRSAVWPRRQACSTIRAVELLHRLQELTVLLTYIPGLTK